MIAKKMVKLVQNSSVIRAMFEEGQRLAKIYGAENVYDFSLGNPNVAAPAEVKEAIISDLSTYSGIEVHGYMENTGYATVREKIAASINTRFSTAFSKDNIIMTVGAAGGLNVVFKTLLDPDDEVITFSPFFGEYRNYVDNYNAKLIELAPNPPTFLPDFDDLSRHISAKTKAIIVNSPNNPTGVVYSEAVIKELSRVLSEKEKEFNTSIYIVCDEPYRELVYGDVFVPYIPKYYKNTIVGYSFSKSLSLPGERIGYLVIPSEIDSYEEIYTAAGVANRILGFVNAPSLMQRAVSRCLECKCDIDYYKRNGETLYTALTAMGYECTKPEGAFYLFVKSPIADDKAFCAIAKKYNLLLVPGSAFGAKGYLRIAYCTAYSTVTSSLPAFEKALKEVK